MGTFSGGQPGANMEDQAAAFADVFNEKYLPVCEKLDVGMGWENYPTGVNFATYPAAMQAVFDRVPSKRLGLEFDPSHFVRQYIDPVSAAWQFKDRILAVHAKDTEITQPVLQQVGIAGQGWWRYRIPGQGIVNWTAFLTVLLQIRFNGGIAVEHEDRSGMRRIPATFPISRSSAKTDSSWRGVFWNSICLDARHNRSAPAFRYPHFIYGRRDQFHALNS